MAGSKLIQFAEICSGIGGLRAGFEASGWQCVHSSDLDPDAATLHRLAFGDCEQRDALSLRPTDLPRHDVLIAGFPCQPFSTSGAKTGFAHSSGNIFEAIASLVQEIGTHTLIFENVEGLLTNQGGYSMARIANRLAQMGYFAEWLLLDACLFGVPQTRRRVFIVAIKKEYLREAFGVKRLAELRRIWRSMPVFSNIALAHGIARKNGEKPMVLGDVEHELRPQIGKARKIGPGYFGGWGSVCLDSFYSGRIKYDIPSFEDELGEICCPSFSARKEVRSVRYYARGVPTAPHFRKAAVAHCLGTNIGAGPTFGIPLSTIKTKRDREYVLEYANWHRDQDERLVFRLRPERALMLFGPGVQPIYDAMNRSSLGSTKKYVLLGNMVSPVVAERVARSVQRILTPDTRTKLLQEGAFMLE